VTGTAVLTALQAPGQNNALGPLPATQSRTGKIIWMDDTIKHIYCIGTSNKISV